MYENLWASVVVFCNQVIDKSQVDFPEAEIGYLDWEAHANIQELPDADIIGSSTVTITEEDPEVFHGSFTIAVATYADDKNLFRLRAMVGDVFRRLRPGTKVPFYDKATQDQKGWMYITPGTIVMPVTRADVRPLQFVQCSFVIDPLTASD